MGIAFFFMLRNWSSAVDDLAEYQVRELGTLTLHIGMHSARTA